MVWESMLLCLPGYPLTAVRWMGLKAPQASSSLSWLGMVEEVSSAVSSDLVDLNPKTSSTSSELVYCDVKARSSKTCVNETHSRSKVESPSMEGTAFAAKLTTRTGYSQ
eukprot:6412995-Ditylum_brightwellii.AAC.1